MSNNKFISIPPYISTSWKNIRALRMEDTHLIITLTDGSVVRVPNLNEEEVRDIFNNHSSYLEAQEEAHKPEKRSDVTESEFLSDAMPFRFGFGTEGLPQAMQHDPSQAQAPDLPPEILDKVSSIAKILSPGDSALLPKPEPHCNCIHCQIARAISGECAEEASSDEVKIEEEEEVSEEDLRFREWDIKEIGDQIYQVCNPLLPEEIFRVCLSPPGCTCGKESCDHLLAVLRS